VPENIFFPKFLLQGPSLRVGIKSPALISGQQIQQILVCPAIVDSRSFIVRNA